MKQREPRETGDLVRRSVNGAAWILVETLTSQGLSLLVFGVMARFITPREFGLASICYVLINSLKIPFDSIGTIVARKEAATDDEFSTAFWITCGVASFSFVVIQLFSFAADFIFSTPELGVVLRTMSIMIPVLGLCRTHEIWLQRHFMFRNLAVRTICATLLGGVIGVSVAACGYGVWALVAQQISNSLGAFILLWLSCPWRPRFVFCQSIRWEIQKSLLSLIGSAVAYTLNQNGDTLLIGLFFGPADVGVYNVAKRLRYALQSVAASPLSGVAMPALAELQSNAAKLRAGFFSMIFILMAVCAPVFIGAAAIAPDAIQLMFGSKWLESVPVFRILMIGAVVNLLIDVNSTVLFLRNRLNQTVYLSVGYTILSGIMFFLISSNRTDYIALPFVLPYVVLLPCSLLLVKYAIQFDLVSWTRPALLPLVASTLMVGAIALIHRFVADAPLVERISSSVTVGALVYASTILLFARERITAAINALKRFK